MKKQNKHKARSNIIKLTGKKYILEAFEKMPEKVIKLMIPYNSKGDHIEIMKEKADEINIKIEYTQKHNCPLGVTAVIERNKNLSLTEFYEKEKGLYIIIDGVYDPHNLGAIIRSSYAFSADVVIVPERDSCGLTEAVVRTSAGAALYSNIIYTRNLAQVVNTLSKRGFNIIATSVDSGRSLHTFSELNEKTVIIFGNEEKGIRNSILKLSDEKLFIEMSNIESLNLSVSAGIVLHHFFNLNNN